MKNTNNPQDQITRKEAIKKMGKYAALTAIGTFIIFKPETGAGVIASRSGRKSF